MSKLIGLLLLLIYPFHYSFSNDLLNLEDVSVDYARFYGDHKDPILYPIAPKERLDLNLNLSLFEYGFLQNTVHSMTDDTQYRLVGWKYRLGVHLGSSVDLYTEHFSQHLLDSAGNNGYPVENSVGIKIYLYKKESR